MEVFVVFDRGYDGPKMTSMKTFGSFDAVCEYVRCQDQGKSSKYSQWSIYVTEIDKPHDPARVVTLRVQRATGTGRYRRNASNG